jgi:hypothetical protein
MTEGEQRLEIGEELAARRLEEAMAEQARLLEASERAAGTRAEMASRMRVQASKLRVAVCDRTLNGIRRTRRRVVEE